MTSFKIHLVLLTTCFMVLALNYWSYKNQLEMAGYESFRNWHKLEQTNISEGNFFTSVSKHQNLLLSSDVFVGIVVYEVEDGGVLDVLADFGEKIDIDLSELNELPVGDAQIVGEELKSLYLAFRPDRKQSLRLVFKIQSDRIESIFKFNALLLVCILIVCIAIINWLLKKQAEQSLRTVYDVVKNLRMTGVLKLKNRFMLERKNDTWNSIADEFRKLEKQTIELTTSKAIARTTQMFAHDVRKPFSMLQALINVVENVDDPLEIRSILLDSVKSINVAMSSIKGLIADIMEIDGNTKLSFDSVDPIDIFRSTLTEVLSFSDDLDASIVYSFNHKHKCKVDVHKINRVISNIINNAIEHLDGDRIIKLSTYESNGWITFSIANSGSYISEEDRAHIFDAFFTKRTKGGTGLGLAIAKKMTELHGGEIWCESNLVKGTEFHLTLPTSNELACNGGQALPQNARGYARKFESIKPNNSSFSETKSGSKQVRELENILIRLLNRHKDYVMRIAIVDDEEIYLTSLEKQFDNFKRLQSVVDVEKFSKPEDFILEIKKGKIFQLVILDLDYKREGMSGFEALKLLQQVGFEGKVCIHSNRSSIEFQSESINLGADLFLQKPMTDEHLITLIISILQINSSSSNSQPRLILFEDEKVFQRQWIRYFGSGNIICFKSWSECMSSFNGVHPWKDVDFVVTDFYLAESETGVDIARNLRELGCNVPIFLSSNLDFFEQSDGSLISAKVDKDPNVAGKQINDWMYNLT